MFARFNFCYSSIFSQFTTIVKLHWKHLLSFLLIGLLSVFLFPILSGESIYDSPRLNLF